MINDGLRDDLNIMMDKDLCRDDDEVRNLTSFDCFILHGDVWILQNLYFFQNIYEMKGHYIINILFWFPQQFKT